MGEAGIVDFRLRRTAALLTATSARLLRLPKAELHVHLDGSLRPATLLELALDRGVVLPATTPEALARTMLARSTNSLEEYLEAFRLTLAVMQDTDAIERIAFELALDHAAENVRYVEVRFCPVLCTARGLSAEDVLDAALAGLARARDATGISASVIVSALRTLPAAVSVEMAELALAYRARGVCGFDLAGAEAGNPVRDHVEALRTVERGGLPITIHAGEGFGAESIRQALDPGHARRIGHGTRLAEDAGLLARVREAGITLEICLTSNVQTGAARTYGAHPLRRFYDEGLAVTLCTDNRLMSGVTLTREYEHARDALGFTWDELLRMARTGFANAFVAPERRAELMAAFERDVAALD
jgi:adenosine deaminase